MATIEETAIAAEAQRVAIRKAQEEKLLAEAA